jgi:FtsP/CotA-like multicopper oxidase with cupredoxin domain
MSTTRISPREFVSGGVALAGLGLSFESAAGSVVAAQDQAADYTLHIKNAAIETAPKRIISAITYNGQFPGPLLRFREGRATTVDVFNDTDTPEQLHWHGQRVGVDVDGSAEEGTPFVAAHGKRRVVFTPGPAGLRFYHTHNRAGANLAAGSMAARSVLFTSKLRESRARMTAKYSWF